MARKLCSVQDIKDRSKGGTDLGATFDTLLGQIIDSVTLQLARHCGRPDWDQLARSEFFNPGSNTRRIFVASPPIAGAPVIQIWESTANPRVYGASELLTLDEDYFVYSGEGIIMKEGRGLWAEGLKTVKITYTGGYLTADDAAAPADLADAAIVQAKLEFDRRESAGLAGQSLEGGSFSFSSGLKIDPAVRQKLQHYVVYPGPF